MSASLGFIPRRRRLSTPPLTRLSTDSIPFKDVAARVLAEEHVVFARVASALVDGRIEFRDDGVPVIVGEDGTRE